jgi:uncharacterized protein
MGPYGAPVGTDQDLSAGDFSGWLAQAEGAIRRGESSDVPCDGCTACCRSSQFVHIGPEESDARDRVPAELLFAAPGLPAGYLLMGYDERGHCPMLVDDRCSIYEHRPRTCRTYDCRVIAATGVELDADQHLIAERAARWRFDDLTHDEEVLRDAVRAAAAFVACHREDLPDGAVPSNPTQRAVLAIDVHDVFVGRDGPSGRPVVVRPDLATVRAALVDRTNGVADDGDDV